MSEPEQKPMPKVVVTRYMLGLLYMQVCAENGTDDETILKVANRDNPCGTTNGWMTVHRENDERVDVRPEPCADYPNRTHFIVSC